LGLETLLLGLLALFPLTNPATSAKFVGDIYANLPLSTRYHG